MVLKAKAEANAKVDSLMFTWNISKEVLLMQFLTVLWDDFESIVEPTLHLTPAFSNSIDASYSFWSFLAPFIFPKKKHEN